MIGIILFAVLLIIISMVMIINPDYWCKAIVRFSLLPYFHPFEIVTRIGFGIIFLLYGEQTLFPETMKVIGYLLLSVGLGLILIPPSKHKQFAVWSSEKFKRLFRPTGFITLVFGVFLIYVALNDSIIK